MKGYCEPFAGKRITLMGLGLLGRGVRDAAFLAECGAHVRVTDKKTEEQLTDSVRQLNKYTTITFRFGGHDLRDFIDTDMVIKAAGVPLGAPEIAAARAAGVPVHMSTALFASYAAKAGATVVGITGTRGKSTITHMVFHVLRHADRRAFLGGNVRGRSTLALLPEVERGDVCVLELDSWQLQGFGELALSPHVAVFSNFMPDHQNYYANMDDYFADKANIFKYQKQGDVLLCGSSIADRVRAARPPLDPVVPEPLPREWALRLVGQHNRENAALAKAALEALGLDDGEIREGLASFEAVEGRLQFVREVGGMKIYNDNNATTPEATIAALDSLDGDITLIVGGSDKGLSLAELVSNIKAHVAHVVLLAHPEYTGSARLAGELGRAGVAVEEASSLAQALAAARSHAQGTILFSPAFASFGMFKNEYDRNDQFMTLVRTL